MFQGEGNLSQKISLELLKRPVLFEVFNASPSLERRIYRQLSIHIDVISRCGITGRLTPSGEIVDPTWSFQTCTSVMSGN